MKQKDWAMQLGRAGYSIYPILPGTKRYTLHHWSVESSSNLKEIEDWWEDFPDDNIGINCGESGLLVVDLDSQAAYEHYRNLEWHHAGTEFMLKYHPGPVIKTRRGWHLYFNQPGDLGNTASKLGTGIDTRGIGGMVVGPGSVIDGYTYKLLHGNLSDIPNLPAWLEYLLVPRQPKRPQYRRQVPEWYASLSLIQWEKRIEDAPDGMQNNTINNAAYCLAMDGVDPEEIEEHLMNAAERGNHPLSRALATIRSGIKAALEAEE